MTQINPEISQKFLNEIKNQTSRVLDIDGVKIKTCKDVFPPQSDFSRTSEKLHTIFENLTNKSVLDVGTGTGVQAVQAAKAGARKVVALDINPAAISCAKENIELNNVGDAVTVLESDLFNSLGKEDKFDVVIANLPITDFPIEGIVESALYDPDYKLHKRFLTEVKNYLSEDGFIVMTHINLKGLSDFEEFEKMLFKYEFTPEKYNEINYAGYLWRIYKIVPVK